MLSISQAIENYLVTSNIREDLPLTTRKFYISDMGKCLRTRWLKRKGISTELGAHVYLIFAMGELLHEWGYKALEAQGLLLQTEEYLSEREHWSGRWDGKVKTDGKPTIFDFKSAGKYAIQKAVGGADNEENIMQLLTYVYLELESKQNIAESGILVYINKEPSEQLPSIYDREYYLTKVRILAIKEEMEKLLTYWVEEKIPPCTCPAWMKNYNSYLPFCLMTEKDIKNYLLMLKDGKKVITTKTGLFTETPNDKESRKEVFTLNDDKKGGIQTKL